MERRTFLLLALATALSPLAAACEADEGSAGTQAPPLNEPGAVDIGGSRPASNGDRAGAGKYYPEGVLNQNVEVEGECNVWMAGEKLNARQASGLPVNGETFAIATWRFSMGSKVIVTSKETNASVVVTVTDRGPNEINYPGQICDITPLVARKLGIKTWYDIPIRLTPYSPDYVPSPVRTQTQNQSAPSTDASGVCVSNFKPGLTRRVGETPHPGDNSRCVTGPNGEPIWVTNK